MEGEDRRKRRRWDLAGELVMGDFMTSNNGGKATNKGPVKSFGHPEAQPRNTGRELLIVESTATQKQIDNDESAAPPTGMEFNFRRSNQNNSESKFSHG